MKKLALVFTLLLLSYFCSYARVKLPEFAFIGKEIGTITVKPVIADINIEFKTKSSVDIYLEKLKIEQQHLDKKDYQIEEPNFMFGGAVRTAIASIFIGNKAYRNYLAKKFYQKDYLKVIDGYEKYSKKLSGGDFENEIKFFYGYSLMETGSLDNGSYVLEEIAGKRNDNISYFAQDRLFEYLNKIQANDRKINICDKLKHFTEYSLNSCLDAYYKKDLFDSVISLTDNNMTLVDKNRYLLTYKIAALYTKGDLSSIAHYDPELYKDVAGYIADANIEKGDIKKAKSMIQKIEQSETKKFYSLKLAIVENDISYLKENLNSVSLDNNKLFLLLYYLNKYFPNIDMELLKTIKFEKPVYYDYTNFYLGLALIHVKNYEEASTYLSKISFYTELIQNSIFYQAICYYYTDLGLAEQFFYKYLELGKDPDKIMLSKYMIAQFLFLDKRFDDSLKALDRCDTIYCNELKAEIFFNKGDYKQASNIASHIFTDRGFLIAASSLFNLKNYEGTLQYLDKLTNPSRESDLLKMLSLFKIGDITKGMDVYKKYNYDREFTNNAVIYLYLGNHYQEVVNILKSKEKITAEQELMLANSYFSLGNYDESLKRYFNLIDKRNYIYESSLAIFSIAQQRKDLAMINQTLTKILSMKFDNKDYLVISMIKYIKESGDNKLALEKLNSFIKSFPASNYLRDAYILRGYTYESLGLFDECLKDVNRILEYNTKDDEAIYIKAICSKKINKNSAIELFENLANKSQRFKEVSLREIVTLSDDPQKIASLLDDIKQKDMLLYYKSIVRMLGLLEISKDFPKYESYIDQLISSKGEEFVPAGYYYKSVLLYIKNDFKGSLNYAMRCYYLFPKSPFTFKSLQLALQIYKKNNEEESAKKIEEIIKNLDKGGK
ncbi:MAG: hypothetical protein N3C60_05745 [Calditerrivibrio sp.]|nr:hypothetical protein [Calditerrivibrio sp.]